MKDTGPSSFKSSDSAEIYDMVLDEFYHLKPKGTIRVKLDKKYNTYALFFVWKIVIMKQ